jgi:hypothetical protein
MHTNDAFRAMCSSVVKTAIVHIDRGDLDLQPHHKESKGCRTTAKVWILNLLDDGTLITGNSLGQFQYWNSLTGTTRALVSGVTYQAHKPIKINLPEVLHHINATILPC